MTFKAIPVDSSSVSGSHSDFPVYIKPSAMTGWEALTLAEAQSIRFYSDEAKTTELAREVVSADELHVKVPSLTTSTTIYADYDGIRSDYATDATYGAEAVWGDYLSVYHLNEAVNNTSGGYIDSAGNLNATGTSMSLTETDGQIGNAQNFDGINDEITTPTRSLSASNSITISAWANRNASLDGNDGIASLIRNSSNDGSGTWQYSLLHNSGNTLRFYSGSGTKSAQAMGSVALPVDTWNYVVGVKNATSLEIFLYINGTEDATDTLEDSSLNQTDPKTVIGAFRDRTSERWSGEIDEVRITHEPRSADWITTEYNNQNDVASFWGTVTDAEEPAPSGTLGLKLGSTTINKVMLGSTEIKKVYLGTTVIYENL